MESDKESESNTVVETNSTPNPRAVICQYCKGDFAPNYIANHEKNCANKTLAERKKSADARDAYRKYYSVAAKSSGAPSRQRPRHYRRQIDEPVALTPAEKRERDLARQREYNKRRPRKTNAARLAKAVSKASHVLFDGKRVQITLSLDWETVRAMIVQLGPDIAIDKIELI